TSPWSSSPSSSGLLISSSAQSVTSTIPQSACTFPATMMFAGRFLAAPTSFPRYFGCSTAGSDYFSIGYYSGNLYLFYSNGSGSAGAAMGAVPATGTDFVLGISASAGSTKSYLNGLPQTQLSLTV